MTSFSEKLKAFFSAVADFLYPFIKMFLSSAGQAVLSSASKAVMAVAADPSLINSAEKRQAAFDAITKDLAAQGIAAAVSTINGAIEAAVAKLKYDNVKAEAAAAEPTEGAQK